MGTKLERLREDLIHQQKSLDTLKSFQRISQIIPGKIPPEEIQSEVNFYTNLINWTTTQIQRKEQEEAQTPKKSWIFKLFRF